MVRCLNACFWNLFEHVLTIRVDNVVEHRLAHVSANDLNTVSEVAVENLIDNFVNTFFKCILSQGAMPIRMLRYPDILVSR